MFFLDIVMLTTTKINENQSKGEDSIEFGLSYLPLTINRL